MRHKKSKLPYFIIGLVLLIGLCYVATRELPLKTEHVEQPLPNTFLSR